MSALSSIHEIDLKCLFVPDIQLQTLMAPEKKQPTPMTGLAVYLPEVVDDSYSVIDQFEKEPDPRDHDVTKKEEKKGKESHEFLALMLFVAAPHEEPS